MSDELRVFRELVLWIWQSHKKPWDYDREDTRLQFIAESTGSRTNSFYTDNELDAYLPSEDNVDTSFPDSRFIYLSPIITSRLMVPRIHLKCDFGRNIPEIRCRLELYLLTDDVGIRSIGYRFESPEGQNDHGNGIHHYYHIQIIQPPTSRIDWLPVHQPAFPLNIDDPVKLLLGLLISLYGLNYLSTILRDANIWKLDDYIKTLPYMNFDSFEWYRLVEIGDPIKRSKGYKILSNLNDFDAFIRGVYPGCNIRSITHSKFEALRDKNKYP